MIEKITEDFRSQKNGVIEYIKKHGIEGVSGYCVLTGIPVIAAVNYIKEDFPEYEEECNKRIDLLIKFYGY